MGLRNDSVKWLEACRSTRDTGVRVHLFCLSGRGGAPGRFVFLSGFTVGIRGALALCLLAGWHVWWSISQLAEGFSTLVLTFFVRFPDLCRWTLVYHPCFCWGGMLASKAASLHLHLATRPATARVEIIGLPFRQVDHDWGNDLSKIMFPVYFKFFNAYFNMLQCIFQCIFQCISI